MTGSLSSLKKKIWRKKPKKTFSSKEFLLLKPIKNPYLEWTKSEKGEVTIMLKAENRKRKGVSKLFSVPKDKRVVLDEIGSFVWDRCDGKNTVEKIARELCDKYRMMPHEAKVSLSNYLQQLAKRRFIGVLIPKTKKEKEKFKEL